MFQICESIDTIRTIKNTKAPPWVDSLKDILLHDKNDLTLKYLSDQLGVHPGHISRAIPKYLSATLGDYLRQKKIKKAINLMHNSTHSLQDITYDCGFSNQSHFIRTFKTYLGMTPKAYRKKIQ